MKMPVFVALMALLVSPAWAAENVSVDQLKQRLDNQNAPVLIDVRTEKEYLDGHIPGAIMIPVDRIESNLDILEPYRKQELVLYCQSGRRASKAADALEEAGFKQVKILEGSYQAWQQSE